MAAARPRTSIRLVDDAVIDAVAERLRPHYARFLDGIGDHVLFTGHSHQAWPDVTRDGQIAAWDDAARLIDGKWSRVLGEILPGVQAHVAKRIGSSRPGDLAIAPNTHELVYRLSTCFPATGTVVTTDAEFHSLRRQLARLEEEGLTVERVPAEAPDFVERFVRAIDERSPTWVALSYVLFTNARIVDLDPILAACAAKDIPVLVDAYHAFNVLELEVDRWPGTVFVTGGGYKYAQTGEGACWMLLPRNAERFRPIDTGWFADFDHLESIGTEVHYGRGGDRFLGATFDPTALYRGLYAMRFFDAHGLTTSVLRRCSVAATSLIIDEYDRLALSAAGLGLASPRDPSRRAGFVAFEHPDAQALSRRLGARGVRTDARGSLLRLGPAPYLDSGRIRRGMQILAETVRPPA